MLTSFAFLTSTLGSGMTVLASIPGEQTVQLSPEELREEYEYYDVLSNEFIGKYPEFSVPETVPEYATQALVDKMVSDIEESFDLLIKKDEQSKISTAVLESALELATGADTEGVITSIVDRFNAAVKNGQQLLDKVQSGDASVTQEMVDNAGQEIMSVMQYLSFKQGDKTDLAKVIALADEMNDHISSYLEEGKDAFVKALADAKEVQADGNAMQEEVNEACENLRTAMAGLQKIPDKNITMSMKMTGSVTMYM